jgi:hypothetical protein
MNKAWVEYLGVLQESAALATQEAGEIADANGRYNAEARRLQDDLALSERKFKALKDRNTRLQVAVRDLVRSLGIALPATATPPSLPPSQLGEALKSAEYNLDQIRKSWDYLRSQKHLVAATHSPTEALLQPPADSLQNSNQIPPQEKKLPQLPILAGVGGAILLLILLLVGLL